MTPDSPSVARHIGSSRWAPTAFVVASLLLLFAIPIAVSYRVRHLRENRGDVSDQARVLVNDLEAALATELYLRDAASRMPAQRVDSIRRATRASEIDDERGLDSLVRRISPEAVERFVEFRALARSWHQRADTSVALENSSNTANTALDVLQAAEALDDYLTRVFDETRIEVRRYAHFEVVTIAILGPIALAAMGVVFWSGRRVLALAQAIEQDRAALARSVEARSSLIHGVTHDVKNPLGAAKGYAELLEEGIGGPLSSEQVAMVRRVRRLVDVALGTIAELLDVAAADAGRLSFERAPAEIGTIVDELADDYRAASTEKQIEMVVTRPTQPMVIMTDAARVRRIIANMVSNAIKYTPPGGRIVLSTRAPDGDPRVGICVVDNGPGIPPDLRDRIFDEFYRAPGTQGSTTGSGLGLAISRRLARALGGDIEVGEAEGGGAQFTLWLPA